MAGGDGSVINSRTLSQPHFQGRNVTDEQWERFFPKKKEADKKKIDKEDVSIQNWKFKIK